MMKFLTSTWIHICLLLVMLSLLVVNCHENNAFYLKLQNSVFDYYNNEKKRERSDNVIIVDIDELSLEKIGQWPWSRDKLALLVDNLTELGAKAIVFDMVFAESDRLSPKNIFETYGDVLGRDFSKVISSLPDNDKIFEESIKKSGKVVTGFTFGNQLREMHPPIIKNSFIIPALELNKTLLKNSLKFSDVATNLIQFEHGAAGNGSFMAFPDNDGILRNSGLYFSNDNKLYPSLALEAFRVSEGLNSPFIRYNGKDNGFGSIYVIQMGATTIPLTIEGDLRVYYRKFNESDENDYVSVYKILKEHNSEKVKERIEGKIVLIGTTAQGLKDLRNTSIETFQAGVEIHANMIEQLYQENYLVRPDLVVILELFVIIFGALLFILLLHYFSVIPLLLFAIVIISGSFYISWIAFADHGVLINPAYSSLSIFIIFITASVMKFIRSEVDRGMARDAFSMYVSPDFMDELLDNPDKLTLGGEEKELTVMFTDIRDFTSISENLTPKELTNLMNDFLTPMTDLVFTNKGTIDKYMGDAMMAFWNAPVDVENHARYACLTALQMDEALKPVNEKIALKAKETGKEPVVLNAGIGVNTGLCSVGNMGSAQRLAYSALGDSVNLTSRLEGQTKQYGVSILIGSTTAKLVPEFAMLELDYIKVKGKQKPVRIFVLLGDEEKNSDPEFMAWKKKHYEMLESYRKQKFDETLEFLKECKQMPSSSLNFYYDMIGERIYELIKYPVVGVWDGVYTATTK